MQHCILQVFEQNRAAIIDILSMTRDSDRELQGNEFTDEPNEPPQREITE